jgi:predicted membrane-bound mannosyltransferase
VLDTQALARSVPLVTALFPALVLAGVGVVAVFRYRNRRRIARMRLSGGRKALALYLAERR